MVAQLPRGIPVRILVGINPTLTIFFLLSKTLSNLMVWFLFGVQEVPSARGDFFSEKKEKKKEAVARNWTESYKGFQNVGLG
jgi:hypothetical protein